MLDKPDDPCYCNIVEAVGVFLRFGSVIPPNCHETASRFRIRSHGKAAEDISLPDRVHGPIFIIRHVSALLR